MLLLMFYPAEGAAVPGISVIFNIWVTQEQSKWFSRQVEEDFWAQCSESIPVQINILNGVQGVKGSWVDSGDCIVEQVEPYQIVQSSEHSWLKN